MICAKRLVTQAKLKSKGGMDKKQCHNATAQYPMNIAQSGIPLFKKIPYQTRESQFLINRKTCYDHEPDY